MQLIAEQSAEIAAGLEIKIGGRRYPVPSFEAASRLFCAARDRFGEGASKTPTPRILQGGRPIAYVSYNGRVWSGSPKDWKADRAPLFDPFAIETEVTHGTAPSGRGA